MNSMIEYSSVELTHKNHFQFGYNGNPFVFRQADADKWFVRYGKSERPVLNFRQECVETARLIGAKVRQPIWVLFSGGSDSEVALRSFVEAQVSVQAAILRFKNDLNVHDISYAVIACEKLGVPYRLFELDLLQFWENRALDYARPVYCMSPQLLTTMYLADQVDGYPVLGSGECLLVKRIPDGYVPGVSPYERSWWDLYEKEKIASWYRHFMVQDREACPGFFQYTPEIILSYLLDPFVQDLVHDRIVGKLCTASSKLKIYQQHFPLLDRPKYTGFEKVQEHDARVRAFLTSQFPAANQTVKTPVAELIQSLAPET